MTVEELIKELEKLPPDAEIWTVLEKPGCDELCEIRPILHISTSGYVYIMIDDTYYQDWANQRY